jgi:hypothetical protein
MIWINIKDKIPPYDTRVLVRGTKSGIANYIDGNTNKHIETPYSYKVYAIAFNECYPPIINMTQIVECDPNAPLSQQYPPIIFEIEEWMVLEQ